MCTTSKQDTVEGSVLFRIRVDKSLTATNPFFFFFSVVKLVKNFRSHKAILQFPNEKFYRGDLVSCGDPAIVNNFLNSQYLPSKKFPVVFHAVSGKDDREASSPSFFNIDEVLQIKYYVQKLKNDKKFRTGKIFLTAQRFFFFSSI